MKKTITITICLLCVFFGFWRKTNYKINTIAMTEKKYTDINFYEILGVDINATQAEIRKCYRKKALECHPDKNPDNPKAVELFLELSKALEILTDTSARSAYDKIFKAKKAAEIRNKQLDSKRQKLKADLEKRERAAFNQNSTNAYDYGKSQKTDEELLQEQIERIRREGSRLLEEEQRLLKEQLQRTVTEKLEQCNKFNSIQHRIKIKWQANKTDLTNGGYSEEKLLRYLTKYGDIEVLVMSKKNGSALIEFKTLDAAQMALAYEKGSCDNPLHLEWLTAPSEKQTMPKSQTITNFDYEDLVMRKLRQAEERKRLIEQIMLQEENKQ